MADCSFNILSVCTGFGGLDLGVELVVPHARIVCSVEREAYCVEGLARRGEEEGVGAFPVWSDLRTFDGRPWRGVVDCITGGYPCQPFSFAGLRLGQDDPRHLWPQVARVIGEAQPGIVFLKNVAGHVTLGFADVRRELERLGYRVTAGLFTAEEVGAPHKRERLFILAAREDALADAAIRGCGEFGDAGGAGHGGHTDGGEPGSDAVADRDGGRCKERGQRDGAAYGCQQHAPCGDHAGGCDDAVADTQRADAGTRDAGEQGQAQRGRDRLADDCGGVADTGGAGCQGSERAGSLCQQGTAARGSAGECGEHVEHAAGVRCGANTGQPKRTREPIEECDQLADAEHQRCERALHAGARAQRGSDAAWAGAVGNATRADECGIKGCGVHAGTETANQWATNHDIVDGSMQVPIFPPGPGERERWADIITRFPGLAPAIPKPAPEPGVRGVAYGLAHRMDRLRATGNGVVPLEAAYAFTTLWACLFGGKAH